MRICSSPGKRPRLRGSRKAADRSDQNRGHMEYAEAITPAGDPKFQSEADRAAIVTLHRWSALPEIEQGDNVVMLIAENLTELAPKLISNPKVAVVEVPMPDYDAREAAMLADKRLTEKGHALRRNHGGAKGDPDRSILTPPPAAKRNRDREAYIAGFLGAALTPRARAQTRGAHRN